MQLQSRIQQADLIITAEGRWDATSLKGKATGNLLVWADEKPVFIFCGQTETLLPLRENIHIFPFLASDASEGLLKQAITKPRLFLQQQLAKAWPEIQSELKLFRINFNDQFHFYRSVFGQRTDADSGAHMLTCIAKGFH